MSPTTVAITRSAPLTARAIPGDMDREYGPLEHAGVDVSDRDEQTLGPRGRVVWQT